MAKVYFFYSTMNAGKSTALLQSNHNYKESNLKTLLFIPTTALGIGNERRQLSMKIYFVFKYLINTLSGSIAT